MAGFKGTLLAKISRIDAFFCFLFLFLFLVVQCVIIYFWKVDSLLVQKRFELFVYSLSLSRLVSRSVEAKPCYRGELKGLL